MDINELQDKLEKRLAELRAEKLIGLNKRRITKQENYCKALLNRIKKSPQEVIAALRRGVTE